ncbi:MAG: tRNA (guanosine(37)-N1)-methyltransferase TrmD [Rubrivivax sp.]|nr:tRNA (guanosine(37)-N1)-methyltransferase TrmD [Rubrivivax sp.]
MRFDVVTLFPELFAPHLTQGVTRRAFGSEAVDVRLWPLRDFAEDSYRRVDDRPYGGGPGMVLLAGPLLRALAAIRAERVPPAAGRSLAVVHFTPTGRRIDQAVVREFASGEGAVLVCGRYEGVDQRFIDACVTHELSLGDFVLSGGELPALALLDAVARLQEGVLKRQSHRQDSFSEASDEGGDDDEADGGASPDGLLEGPQYSRPESLPIGQAQLDVPAVLLSGHHGRIARWKRERSLELTARRRPDLIERARAAGRLTDADERFLAALAEAPAPDRDAPL